MTQKSIDNEISKQLFRALDKIEKLEKKLDNAYDVIDELKKDFSKKEKKYLKEINDLKIENKELKDNIQKLELENAELKSEILKLRTSNNKNSSNSSKPSSTNGYKKVITNNRQKSQNKPGKPKGYSSTNLSVEKLNNLINSGDVEFHTVNINMNKNNKNKPFKSVKVIDLKIVKTITEYRYYPNEDGTYNIPKNHNRAIQYGNEIKAICCCLNNEIYNSTDGIVRFISSITNKGIELAKSTVLSWNNLLAKNLSPELNKIESDLILAYFLNCDDSSLKINGESYNDLCICNDTHTRLVISERKDHDSWKEKTLIEKFKGVIVKDGTDVFNGFGIFLSQCCSHILRYIKGVFDFIDHKGAKKMYSFLQKCIHIRKEKISQNIMEFTSDELKELDSEYANIFKEWKLEWMKSNKEKNPVYEDERKILARLEDEKEKSQILYFLKDFNVPATNNRAEVDQRGVKIKQKIGKFRNVTSAQCYADIRSCILTYKKNNINVLQALKAAFNSNPIIV